MKMGSLAKLNLEKKNSKQRQTQTDASTQKVKRFMEIGLNSDKKKRGSIKGRTR